MLSQTSARRLRKNAATRRRLKRKTAARRMLRRKLTAARRMPRRKPVAVLTARNVQNARLLALTPTARTAPTKDSARRTAKNNAL
jgi:phosphoribosylcarboxyaminoimidazole (NCAIR) mutase